MEDWLFSALAEKRKARALTETARQVGIEPTRLSRIDNQYVEPTAKEIEVLTAFLKPATPAPAPAPAAPPPPAAQPAKPAVAPVAAKPSPAPVSAAPKPLPSTPRLSSGLAALELPVQTRK